MKGNDMMDVEKVKEILEREETNYVMKNEILRGLVILSKYDDDMEISAEHDIIYACSFEKTATKMTTDDIKKMGRLGWFESEESWACYP